MAHADNDPAKPIVKVDLSDCNAVTDAGLKELAGFKGLQTLSLTRRNAVTDAGLKELAGLKGLQTLSLWGCQVTDAGLKDLAGLKGLHTLSLCEHEGDGCGAEGAGRPEGTSDAEHRLTPR